MVEKYKPNANERSITDEHLAAVDELIRLEEQNITTGLTTEQKERWTVLTQSLFGPMKYPDQRRYFRIQTDWQVTLIDGENVIEAAITSFSAGGLFLYTEKISPDMLNRTFRVIIPFPNTGNPPQTFTVQVCWVCPPTSSFHPGIGVTFLHLTEEQRSFLLYHLRTHLMGILEISREKYHFFFEHASDIAMLLSTDGIILEANEVTEKFLDISAEQLMGQSIDVFVPPTCIEEVHLALSKIRQHQRIKFTSQIKDASGHAIPVEISLTPFNVRDLKLGAIMVARDLREIRRIQEQKRAMERRLYQADKLATIGQITASIAHDISNPLAYVLVNLATLEELIPPIQALIKWAINSKRKKFPVDPETLKSIDDDFEDLIEECLEGCQRIRDFVAELRNFFRMDSEAASRIDVNQALDASLRIVKNLINHRAKIKRDYAPNLPLTYLNYGKLTQVFLNLLTNAAQAFEQADLSCNLVQIKTSCVDGELQVRIQDNGRGIPPEIKDLIFEPFFTTHREEGGTGLGLTIVRECIENLNGSLSVESKPSKGTCFIVTLPIYETPAPSPTTKTISTAGPRHKLLLIDDDRSLLRSLNRALSRTYEVVSTHSPRKALTMIKKQSFDVVLCDVMMPELGGLQFYQQTLATKPELASRIIFMTGGTFSLGEERQLAELPNVVLSKPIDMEQLTSILQSYAQKLLPNKK